MGRHSTAELGQTQVRTIAKGAILDREVKQRIMEQCVLHPLPFVSQFCQIYDSERADWIPFTPWPDQVKVLNALTKHKLMVILKARQLGLTWLVLSYALWKMVFRPKATVLLFSQRDDEATKLLDMRLAGMWERLPDWLKVPAKKRNDHELELTNGSVALAFPTTAGRSYTATDAIVDEADYCPSMERLMLAVKPTIEAGGQMVMLSTSNKDDLRSVFKNTYRAARKRENNWKPAFLPWTSKPVRDQAWYDEQARDIEKSTGSLDGMHQEYPATDVEAMAAKEMDARIPGKWIDQCYLESDLSDLSDESDVPAIPRLEVYELPIPGERYVIGADPAEGNPTSDNSSITVMKVDGQEEVAAASGKWQEVVFAEYIKELSLWYNNAPAMVERNNHGHAVLLELSHLGGVQRLRGSDGKPGWLTTRQGKVLAYSMVVDLMKETSCRVRSFATADELRSIEGASLSAPSGTHDDRAMSFVLCIVALSKELPDVIPGEEVPEALQFGRRNGGSGRMTFDEDEEGRTIFVREEGEPRYSSLRFGR